MKTVIEMAREAGFAEKDAMYRVAFVANKNNLERFAELVRAEERDACCAIVWGLCGSDNVAQQTVDAIRARGDT